MNKRFLKNALLMKVKYLNIDIFILDLTTYHLWKTDQFFKNAFLLNKKVIIVRWYSPEANIFLAFI